MTRIYHSGDGSRRFLFWDEQNRLKGFGQDDRVGHYRYDAHGERYFKWTGEAAWMNYNGRILRRMWFSSPTLYASPYLVATPQGYTKHYYAGMDRIASRIGGGGLIELGMEPWELDMKKQQVTEAAYRFYEEDLGLRDMDIVENLSVLYEYEGRVHDGNECYFYHTDQIGSSNWITNQDGQPVQHLQYLPFGEPWIDQRVSEWNSRYTFSGKERDAGTGLSYFGARYYDSGLSIWLSADPLMSKYPSLSPYTYCANNPVRYFDPDGRWIPGLDDNGNVTYTAEKGDNLYTFQKQFGVGGREALNIFKQSGLSTNDNVSFEAGEAVIGGSIVQEHTGNDVLKGQWYNLTNTQKASQIMFGMLYSKHHNQTADNGTYSMNINDFIDGFYVGSSGLDFNDVYIPAKGGGLIQIDHMSLAPSSTMGNPPLIYYRRFGGDENLRTDGSNFSSYHFFSAKNKDAKSPFKAMIISIPTGINNSKFRKSY